MHKVILELLLRNDKKRTFARDENYYSATILPTYDEYVTMFLHEKVNGIRQLCGETFEKLSLTKRELGGRSPVPKLNRCFI